MDTTASMLLIMGYMHSCIGTRFVPRFGLLRLWDYCWFSCTGFTSDTSNQPYRAISQPHKLRVDYAKSAQYPKYSI